MFSTSCHYSSLMHMNTPSRVTAALLTRMSTRPRGSAGHRPDLGGEIAHSAVIVVVDRDGVVRHRQVGVQDDLEPLVAAVSAVR